jgi:integrase
LEVAEVFRRKGEVAMSTPAKVPTYRRHKQSGQAIVTLTDGMGGRSDVLLGKFGSKESRVEYARVIAEWEAAGRRPPIKTSAPDLTINELALAYWRFVEGYYVKDGAPTSEQDTIRQALRFVRQLYGHSPATEFGPLALKAVRQAMVRHPVTRKVKVTDPETGQVRRVVKVICHGLARRFINKQVGRIKRMFAWGVEEELVPAAVHQALLRVKGLAKGRGGAREKPRVKPVPRALVDATLPHLPPVVRVMVEVQYLCGGRPQDVLGMRACDIDMTGAIWEYQPARHKTQHHADDDSPDRERIVFLGPKAQTLLNPFLTLNLTDYLFSPKRSESERCADRRQRRRSKLWPSHARRLRSRYRAGWSDHYDTAAYRRAITRACQKAGVPVWTPNQLRHARATEIRKHYGLEASQAVLGHRELGVTQVYAEVDREAARRVMAEVG